MTGGAGDLWFVSSLRIPSTLPKARVQSRIDGQNITSLTKSWILRTWPDFSEIFWPWVCWVCTIPVWNNSNNWNAIQVEKYWWDPESSNFSSAAAASETPSWKDRWLAMPRKHSQVRNGDLYHGAQWKTKTSMGVAISIDPLQVGYIILEYFGLIFAIWQLSACFYHVSGTVIRTRFLGISSDTSRRPHHRRFLVCAEQTWHQLDHWQNMGWPDL